VRVVLKADITGLRNGVEWPSRGSTVDLPDDEAVSLLNAGLAVAVKAEARVEAAVKNDQPETAARTTKPRKPRS